MKRKIFSILFTLVLVVSLMLVPAVAQAATPEPTMTYETRVTGTSAPSFEQAYAGLRSAKMTTTVGNTDCGMVRFEFAPDELTLDDLTTLSYWEYVSARDEGTFVDVFIDIWLDFNDDGVADTEDYPGYMQAEPLYTVGEAPLNTWTSIDAMSLKWSTLVGPDDPYNAPTISDLQAGASAIWTNSIDFGPLDILRIDIRVGYGGTWDDFTGYADDVVINEYTQGFEPEVVGLTAEVDEIIAISVTPTSINFGTVTPGTPAPGDTITVKNIGQVTVDVNALLDPTGGVFQYLFLNYVDRPGSGSWSAGDLGMGNMVPASGAVCVTKLDVPVTYNALGPEAATLIFLATKS